MSGGERIRQHLLTSLAADRKPGFSFTGHFLGTRWPHVGRDGARLTIPAGLHCTDDHGRVELAALLMSLDTAMSTATRPYIVPGERLATTYLNARFTGAPFIGQPIVDSVFEGVSSGDAIGQLLARATAGADGVAWCHGSAAFVRLPPPPDARLMAPLPWQQEPVAPVGPLDPGQLDARERAIMAMTEAALAGQSGSDAPTSFLRRFWGLLPVREGEGACCRMPAGPHTANRVGHVQGGLLLGLAAETAIAAVPLYTVLSNISAWFISPGKGVALKCRSTPIHTGRSFAVVKSEILGEGGVRVMEAVTAHATAL